MTVGSMTAASSFTTVELTVLFAKARVASNVHVQKRLYTKATALQCLHSPVLG
jgi:hypothetical protein